MARNTGATQRVLALLRKGREVNETEINLVATGDGTRRVRDLRARGFDIRMRRDPSRPRGFLYLLIGEPLWVDLAAEAK